MNVTKGNAPTLRMAIEYFPRAYPNASARYMLMVYGQTGKVLFQSPFQSLEDLLGALRTAGISLEKEEEQLVIHWNVEEHYVFIAEKIYLNHSQVAALGLKPTNLN